MKQRVATLEATGVTCSQPNDSTGTNSSDNGSANRQMNDCVVDSEADIRTFKHDSFTTLQDGRVCYCNVSQVPYPS